MKHTEIFKTILGESVNINFTSPNQCPICHAYQNPKVYGGSVDGEGINAFLSVHCGCHCCGLSFLARYKVLGLNLDAINANHTYNAAFEKSEPETIKLIKFSNKISTLSKGFVTIYSQAEKAEENHLNEIAGMGYRKALEFLVKDFAIKQHPEDEGEIINMPLSKCINNYLNFSQNLKALALASTWIGNDETHYVRKYEQYDVTDLKRFLTSIINLINDVLEAEGAIELINSK